MDDDDRSLTCLERTRLPTVPHQMQRTRHLDAPLLLPLGRIDEELDEHVRVVPPKLLYRSVQRHGARGVEHGERVMRHGWRDEYRRPTKAYRSRFLEHCAPVRSLSESPVCGALR